MSEGPWALHLQKGKPSQSSKNARSSSGLGCASTGSNFYLVFCPWILRLRSHYHKILKFNIYIDNGFTLLILLISGWWLTMLQVESGSWPVVPSSLGGKIKLFRWVQSGGVLRCGFAKCWKRIVNKGCLTARLITVMKLWRDAENETITWHVYVSISN